MRISLVSAVRKKGDKKEALKKSRFLCASFYPLEVKEGFEPLTVFFAVVEAQQSSLPNVLVYLDKVVANFAASEAT